MQEKEINVTIFFSLTVYKRDKTGIYLFFPFFGFSLFPDAQNDTVAKACTVLHCLRGLSDVKSDIGNY